MAHLRQSPALPEKRSPLSLPYACLDVDRGMMGLIGLRLIRVKVRGPCVSVATYT